MLVGVTAAPAQAAPSVLRFASYNVMKSNAGPPTPGWEVRRERAARTIAASGADVIGIHEATEHPVPFSRSQWTDLQQLVAPTGYAAPRLEENRCGFRADCNHTATLLYRPDRVHQVPTPTGAPSAGAIVLRDIAPQLTTEAWNRKVTYAYLAANDGGTPFLAVSVHLDSAKDAAAEADRVAFGQSLTAWVEAMNARSGLPGAPAVLLADLNSHAARQPMGAQRQLTDRGWQDAAIAGRDLTPRLGTINVTPRTARFGGFPPRPWLYRPGRATRIDYVMGLRARMIDHRVVVALNPDGTFDEAYRAGDHNMVLASVEIG